MAKFVEKSLKYPCLCFCPGCDCCNFDNCINCIDPKCPDFKQEMINAALLMKPGHSRVTAQASEEAYDASVYYQKYFGGFLPKLT